MCKYRESTGISHVFVVLAVIPLLPLICVAVIDAIPMNSPDLGFAHSGTVWARDSYALSLMFSLYIPELKLSRQHRLLTTIAATVISHTFLLCLIILMTYPLPFTLLWMAGPWLGTFALSLELTHREFQRKHPEVRNEVRRFAAIMVLHTSAGFVITGFNEIFVSVPEEWQTFTALLVPTFKIIERNLICRRLRGKDDLMPEMVVFIVEITNALFISTSMQQAASAKTSAMLILIDFVHLLISLSDLRLMLQSVRGIADKMGIGTSDIISSAMKIAMKYPELGHENTLADSFHTKSDVFRLSTLQQIKMSKTPFQVGRQFTGPSQVVPSPANIPVSSWGSPTEQNITGPVSEDLGIFERTTPRERLYFLQKSLQILFLTEFLLLNEFMEVLTPIIYSCYLLILFYWPNREYYPAFEGLDETHFHKNVRNILVYGLLEVASFVLLVVMIYRTTHKFPFHQLAYTVNCSRREIQCKLVIWLVLLMQSTIPQLYVKIPMFSKS
ncbi:hypothetical protein PHMEG_00025973 [Phytophthora megakarya]|uniref:Uncharacterized protein n=1 Tax=Phytophthora megakarya TaxID=4795 RepID=A0A225VC56_9STRA|nr:hypothetical protein PHMEG_00025973 [Phytophthora megakarya]